MSGNFQLSSLRLPHPNLDFLRFNRHEEQTNDANFTAIVSTPVVVDSIVFSEYIAGSTVDNIVVKIRHEPDMVDAHEAAIAEYVKGQLHLMQYLEYYVHRPRYFLEQRHLLPFGEKARVDLIESYYAFDEPVMLEFLGRKLNSRARTYLPEVAIKTGIPIASCKRQFENIKRIAKQSEDEEGVPLVNEIMEKFALPEPLAMRYAHILFLNINRVDTTKRCLAHFKFADFDFCASILIKYWTTTSSTMTLDDIDEPLTQHAQQLKSLLVENKTNFDQLCVSVRGHINTLVPKAHGSPQSNSNGTVVPAQTLLHILENRTARGTTQLRAILRTSFSLVAGIDASSTLRDVLGIIVEKIVDTFASLGLRSEDMELFYESFAVHAALMLVDQMPDAGPSIQALNRALTGTKLLGRRLFRQKPSLFGPLNKIRSA
ncbi:acidic fibroblast growth factor binding-domain-containing protein [Kickxella alabastrina]|uniref:acidic fibroblast growth factor binding-domain-containing protein n=1 Tax=Kickxella alabastrina TaxID=61397 RepID=UPI002220F217|nr:acidic fibroblast growth factor binding-domain-containing protein [Kickxella alabastrina]KAI7829227.1 acidic fibroblast growth factor binding-domain-containing protein [Kickxella alabastrina]KAJ1947752.1 hypothetical protein GGF37_000128 [Kickxella alabastrina]